LTTVADVGAGAQELATGVAAGVTVGVGVVVGAGVGVGVAVGFGVGVTAGVIVGVAVGAGGGVGVWTMTGVGDGVLIGGVFKPPVDPSCKEFKELPAPGFTLNPPVQALKEEVTKNAPTIINLLCVFTQSPRIPYSLADSRRLFRRSSENSKIGTF
jgi:hypothetical protein